VAPGCFEVAKYRVLVPGPDVEDVTVDDERGRIHVRFAKSVGTMVEVVKPARYGPPTVPLPERPRKTAASARGVPFRA
jgi:hypothetical protein